MVWVYVRTNPLIRTASDLATARQQGFVNGHYEHRRDSKYHFTCAKQEVSKVSVACCLLPVECII
jgi:hypothetical protein